MDDLIYIDFSPRLRTSSYASTNALWGKSFLAKRGKWRLSNNKDCPGARSFIAVGTVLAILIMSWLEAFASGLFALIYARRGCFAEGELWQTFCCAVGVCLSWSIRCDVELVWSCYVSCMAWAVGGVLIVLRWKLYYI